MYHNHLDCRSTVRVFPYFYYPSSQTGSIIS
nr:MAG TPA: hypothetical protein [Caudoviricetes sp.]